MGMHTNAMAALFLCAGGAVAAPITYQGTLEDNGEAANGVYDMRFTLSDAPVLGFALQFIDVDDVEVVDGLFEVELDFSDFHFTGADRWLSIQVEGTFLTPRTKVNYAPYAIRASRATIADDLEVPWVVNTDTDVVDATSSRGIAISGISSASAGTNPGVFGRTDSRSDYAFAIHGVVESEEAGLYSAGVRGQNNSTGISGVGVYGSHAGFGFGMLGESEHGVGTFSSSISGAGVWAVSDTSVGLFSQTNSGPFAIHAFHDDANNGVFLAQPDQALEATNPPDGTNVKLAGEEYAVEALNDEDPGEGTGVFGSGGRIGVYGEASPGGFGPSLVRTGVQGFAGAFITGADTFYGVQGFAQNPIEGGSRTSYGVYGGAQVGNSTNTAYGVYGETFGPGGTQFAGFFSGNVHVQGTLSKSLGSFKIDHPLDPENKYLSHSFVESPDMMNIYSGVITLDAEGIAVVELPDYFEALNRDFRYQLTAIGAPMPDLYIASEISANRFEIAGGVPDARVSWEVTGVRHDPSALHHPIKVEEAKPEHHRGKYLNPEAYGHGDEHAIHARPRRN
jgi:hypothetical protein